MTKYVFNSGGLDSQLARKKQFHQELVKGLGNNPRFLMCNFAQAREYWESKFPDYCDWVAQDMPKAVKPVFELAIPADFVQQCAKADVIHFSGGDDHLLQYWMRQYDLPTLFKDKVVSTNSASSNMLAAHYWTCDWRACGNGFGILPIKFIPHYKSDFGNADPRGPIDWQQAYDDLAAFGDQSLPIYALEEADYIVL